MLGILFLSSSEKDLLGDTCGPLRFGLLPCSRNTKFIKAKDFLERKMVLLQTLQMPKMIMGVYSGLSVTFGTGKSNTPIYLLRYQGLPRAPGLFVPLRGSSRRGLVALALGKPSNYFS